MQSLTDQGLLKAREMISQVFADPNSLDDIGVLSFQLEKQLIAAESQLNGAVQSKLDSLKRAVDLMDESAVKLNKLSANINRIDEKIAQTNTAISKHENLKKVHNVRDNLSKVIAQVEFFAKVPERAKELRQLLDKKPASLKEVYVESLKYESLRVALMKEIRVSRNRKKSVTSSGRHSPVTGVTMNAGGDYSEDAFKKIRGAVENHLQIVPELVQDVRQRVFGNIERMWDLAVNSPQDLVASFEIIEMQQEYNDRRNKAMLAAASDSGKARSTLSPSEMHENIVATVDNTIKRMMDERVEGEFEAMGGPGFSDQGDRPSQVTALIMSANQVLQRMSIFREEVVPCMPPAYQPMLTFVNSFEYVLLPRVEALVGHVEQLKVGELLDLVNWTEYHKACMHEFGFADRPSIETLAATKAELMIEYKNKIKTQVAQWFENIRARPLEITKGADDTLVTSHPEDMFNILHAQVEVAREKLPMEYTKEVAIACLQVLQSSQRQSYDSLSRSMEPDVMCAVINDNQRMQEKCDEFGEYLCRFVEEGPDKELLLAILEEVSSEYIALAVKAVNFLAKCILGDLEEEVFGRLYSQEWESGVDCIGTLTATLSDYFADLSKWLSEYFYSKFVKELLVAVVDTYVMSLRRRANGTTFCFSSEILAANRIIHDKTAIEDFFSQFADVLRRGGLKKGKRGGGTGKIAATTSSSSANDESPLTTELEPLINLARVVSSRNPFSKETEGHVKALFERWGVDGLRVVQAAILCYPSGSSSADKEAKRSGVETARRLFEANAAAGQYNTEPLPDYVNYDAYVGLGHNAGQGGASGAGGGSTREAGKGFMSGWGRKKAGN